MITFREFIQEALSISSGGGGTVIENHNGVRNQPLSNKLRSTLENGLAGTGLDWHSFSGGQPAAGPNRVGGPRHNGGNASDGDFIDAATKKKLDADNPSDRARISNALKKLREAGIAGFGWDSAATGKGHYMGSSRFHLDVHGPGVWGSSKTSATAAPWVVSSIGGMPTGASMSAGDEAEATDSEPSEASDANGSDYNSPMAAAKALTSGLTKAFGFLGGGI